MYTHHSGPFAEKARRTALPTLLGPLLRSLALGSLCGIAGTAFALSNWQDDAAALAACDGQSHQSVLQASPENATSSTKDQPQAVWLNRGVLQWPGAPGEGHYKLYYGAQAQLQALPGQPVRGASGSLAMTPRNTPLSKGLAQRFAYLAPGVRLAVEPRKLSHVAHVLRQQVLLVQEDTKGQVLRSASIQLAGALDDLYAPAAQTPDLGVTVTESHAQFKLWAPTAQGVRLCSFNSANGLAATAKPMQRDNATGNWTLRVPANQSGQYYSYLVDVVVPGTGVVRNRVTDPYSVSLNANSQRSAVLRLDDPRLKPAGWDRQPHPSRVKAAVDMAIYELHVRDFSIGDLTVPPAQRGKYLAFTAAESNGMQHLRQLAQSGMTDVHLLPIFDIASVPEVGCSTPDISPPERGDSETPQAIGAAHAAKDCFNWGYDPLHFNAPEGSYASDANDAAKRVLEIRQMVMALHAEGLRVGMDVVYNHTSASGQHAQSVLDRIVPGYYHRLNAQGQVERSTCCDNTATENRMMGKLMIDSAVLWAKHYAIDSFRFDLMAHQPRAAMEVLQRRVNQASGRHIHLIGEGWNFGEVANGARFVQASQRSLNGSGIGTFSDRARDAIRGGSAADNGDAQIRHQGYTNGLVYAPNGLAQEAAKTNAIDLLRTADMVRVGLAGSLRDFELTTYTGERKPLSAIDYGGQGAGYVSQPGEVVNYVENHDNQTLYDANVFKLPLQTTAQDRARVQVLAVALNTFSQGIAYYHAGTEILRSKSMDRNSYDSGDWFNRLDWTYQTNFFGTGLPPKADNAESWPWMAPLLANPNLRPSPADIIWANGVFNDLLRIRASTTLLRLRTAQDIRHRLSFPNTGPTQNPVVMVGHLTGQGYAGAAFKELLYFVNVDPTAQELTLPKEANKTYELHPVLASDQATDTRVRTQAQYNSTIGRFTLPARSAVVYVVR